MRLPLTSPRTLPPALRTRRAVLRGTAAAAAVTLGIAACVPGGGSASSEAQPTSALKPATLRVVGRTGQEAEMWAIRLPAFEAAYPGLKVQTDLHGGDMEVVFSTLIASGTLGDVSATSPAQAQPQRFYIGKSMRELDPLIARDKLDLKQWYQVAVDAGRVDGKVISLPFKGKMSTVALFYNQSLIEQAGMKVPDLNTTVDQFLEMAMRLTKPESQWGIAGTLSNVTRRLTASVRVWNAEILSNDLKRATLNTAEMARAWGWYYDMIHRRKIADPNERVPQRVFLAGNAAFLINEDFSEKSAIHPAAQQQGFTYGATLFPKGPTGRRGGTWQPDALQLATASPNQDQAWALLKWLTDQETGLTLALQKTGSTTPGARPDVFGDPRFLNHSIYPKVLQELERDAAQLPEGYQTPHNFKIPEFDAVLDVGVKQVRANEAEPTAAWLRTVNDDLQRVLDLPR